MTRDTHVMTRDTRELSHDVDVSTRDILIINRINRVFIHDARDLIRDTHVSIQVMRDTAQHILDLSARLRELRELLDKLDAERAEVKRQIDECMAQMGAAGDDEPMPKGMTEQIRWALRRHPNRPLAPIDISTMLRLTSERDVGNVRTLLARMARDGRVRKVAHGRYVTTE